MDIEDIGNEEIVYSCVCTLCKSTIIDISKGGLKRKAKHLGWGAIPSENGYKTIACGACFDLRGRDVEGLVKYIRRLPSKVETSPFANIKTSKPEQASEVVEEYEELAPPLHSIEINGEEVKGDIPKKDPIYKERGVPSTNPFDFDPFSDPLVGRRVSSDKSALAHGHVMRVTEKAVLLKDYGADIDMWVPKEYISFSNYIPKVYEPTGDLDMYAVVYIDLWMYKLKHEECGRVYDCAYELELKV